jgi:hypothetical protein
MDAARSTLISYLFLFWSNICGWTVNVKSNIVPPLFKNATEFC